MIRQRVLIVSASPQRREQIRELLCTRKWASVEACDLSTAVEQVSSGRFGCAIVDADPLWTLRSRIVSALKAVDRRIVVIVASDRNTTELERALRQQPIFYYFLRRADGGDEDELLQAVANALDKVCENISVLAGSPA